MDLLPQPQEVIEALSSDCDRIQLQPAEHQNSEVLVINASEAYPVAPSLITPVFISSIFWISAILPLDYLVLKKLPSRHPC